MLPQSGNGLHISVLVSQASRISCYWASARRTWCVICREVPFHGSIRHCRRNWRRRGWRIGGLARRLRFSKWFSWSWFCFRALISNEWRTAAHEGNLERLRDFRSASNRKYHAFVQIPLQGERKVFQQEPSEPEFLGLLVGRVGSSQPQAGTAITRAIFQHVGFVRRGR